MRGRDGGGRKGESEKEEWEGRVTGRRTERWRVTGEESERGEKLRGGE